MKDMTNRNSYRSHKVILAAVSLVLLISSLCPAAVIPVFECDFESGVIPAEISGVSYIASTQGYSSYGLGDYLLHNDTGGGTETSTPPDDPGMPTVLTLTGLPFHTHIEIRMDLAIIDSWDGSEEYWGDDFFNVTVDGQLVFSETITNFEGNPQTFAPAPEEVIVQGQALFAVSDTEWDVDSLYSMGPSLDNIPHSGSDLTITFHADGDGWQGGADESWAIDNIEIILIIEVLIDIKPCSDPNPINPGSNGLVPVAILSSPEFDAITVDPTTVELAGASVAVRGKDGKPMAHVEDVDGDGLLDLLVQVETQDLDLGASGTVKLTGTTFGEVNIVGYDEVVIVPPGKK